MYYYAIRKGYRPGIYESWTSAKDQVSGYTSPEYKKFKSRAEAEYFMQTGRIVETKVMLIDEAVRENKNKHRKHTGEPRAVQFELHSEYKKRNAPVPVSAPVLAPVPGRVRAREIKPPTRQVQLRPPPLALRQSSLRQSPFSFPKLDHRPGPNQTQTQKSESKDKALCVWTDGSSFNNGKINCQAGYGVFFSRNNPLNLSMPMVGILGEPDPPSNQKAELKAIASALAIVKTMRGFNSVIVYSDSKYSIQCITVWVRNWQKNGWKTSHGENVKHRQIITEAYSTIEMLKQKGIQVRFEHVRAHKKAPADTKSEEYTKWYGNSIADKLAQEGTEVAKGLSAASCSVSLIPRKAKRKTR